MQRDGRLRRGSTARVRRPPTLTAIPALPPAGSRAGRLPGRPGYDDARSWNDKVPRAARRPFTRHKEAVMDRNGQTAAGVTVPDTKLAREATELVRESTTDLIYDHSRRVYWWGSLQGRNRDL